MLKPRQLLSVRYQSYLRVTLECGRMCTNWTHAGASFYTRRQCFALVPTPTSTRVELLSTRVDCRHTSLCAHGPTLCAHAGRSPVAGTRPRACWACSVPWIGCKAPCGASWPLIGTLVPGRCVRRSQGPSEPLARVRLVVGTRPTGGQGWAYLLLVAVGGCE